MIELGTAWERFRQLLAVSAFGIAQPLLGLMAGYPGFLVAHRVLPIDLVLLLLVLFLVPALVLFVVQRAVGLMSGRLEVLVHVASVVGLCALFAMTILNRFWSETSGATVLLAALPGALLVVGIARLPKLRESIEFLAAAPILFIIVFLANPDVRALALQSRAPLVEAPAVRAPVPIVVLIFDELPLTSLLDARGEIDPVRYPSFARLAGSATWFRNATSVTSYTQQAVPAILTGLYPGTRPLLPIASEQPRNLFSLLAGSHVLNAFESQMQLGHPDVLPRPPLRARFASLIEDSFVVYLHMILPDALATELPKVTETWRGFGAGGLIPVQLGGKTEGIRVNHPEEFEDFIAAIQARSEAGRPGLHFIHSVMPHRPWQYLPSGHVYFPYEQHGVKKGFVTIDGDWWQQEGYQRHLLQVAYVDRLLGQLLDELERLGLYEEALVVVTADHGVGFWPNDNARIVGLSAHPEDILSIPLLVKRPGQTHSEVSVANVETIDILPSIADLVEADLSPAGGGDEGWRFDGCSLFDLTCPKRAEKRAYSSTDPKPQSMDELLFDPELGLREESLHRKLRWFGDGLYRFGPYAGLVGKRLEGLRVDDENAGTVVLDRGPRPGFHDPLERQVPVRISGVLEYDAPRVETPHVAVVVAGEIQTVVPAPADARARRRVLAMMPEESLSSAARIELYLIDGTVDQPRLSPLRIR